MSKPRLQLVGKDGNAFAIIGHAQNVMRQEKWPKEKIDEVIEEMTSGDYDHLLQTCTEYFEVY